MNIKDRFTVNENKVAAKLVDGEAILINLMTGLYYSMDKVGALIWSLIVQRYSVEEITNTILDQYKVADEQVHTDVERLATELLEEDLISRCEEQTPIVTEAQIAQCDATSYESPKLSKFSDMAEMFALDPPLPGLAETYTEDTKRDSH